MSKPRYGRTWQIAGTVAWVVLGAVACDHLGDLPSAPRPTIDSVTVQPRQAVVVRGGWIQLNALAWEGRGGFNNLKAMTWASSNTTKASVDDTGLVTLRDTGAVTITVSIAGKRASTQLASVIVSFTDVRSAYHHA